MNDIKDPQLYRRLSEPHTSFVDLNTALDGFSNELRAIREKYKIADVVVVILSKVARSFAPPPSNEVKGIIMDEFLEDHLRCRIKELEAELDEARSVQEAIVREAQGTDDLRLESYRLLFDRYKNLKVAASEALEALKETEEALSWLCGALRDQATGHPETLALWNSTETVRRIEQARAVLKKQSGGETYVVASLAGMAWRDIAASAYKAYVASTEHSAYRGLPLKEWENLHPAIQTAWEAAARQVGECTSLVGDARPPDEQQWAGWGPPHMKGEQP